MHSKYPHPRWAQNNSCWIKFEVKEWLKPATGSQEIWVKNIIADGRKQEDYVSLRFCEYEAGKSYLIYGSLYKGILLYAEQSGTNDWEHMLAQHTGTAANDNASPRRFVA